VSLSIAFSFLGPMSFLFFVTSNGVGYTTATLPNLGMTLTPEICHMGLARPFWIPRVTQPVSQFLGCNGVGQSANYPPKFLRQPLCSMLFLSLSQWSRLPATTLPNSWDDLTHQSILRTMSITWSVSPLQMGAQLSLSVSFLSFLLFLLTSFCS